MDGIDKTVRNLRSEIDIIDADLLRLLNARGELVVKILSHKLKLGLEPYAPDREREILERLREANGGPFPGAAVEDIFRIILDHSLASLAKIADPSRSEATNG